jgi:hypothetical protein
MEDCCNSFSRVRRWKVGDSGVMARKLLSELAPFYNNVIFYNIVIERIQTERINFTVAKKWQ